MDREADIIDVINCCHQNKGQQFIIRARHDRSTLSRHEKDKAEAPRTLPPLSYHALALKRNADDAV